MISVIKNAKINHRVTIGFSLVLTLMIVLTVVGAFKVNSINDHLTAINDENSVKQRYAINFRGSVHDRAIAVRDLVLLIDPSELAAARREIDQLTSDYEDSLAPGEPHLSKFCGVI